MVNYRLYPTLLNSFSLYLKDVVAFETLIGQINRVKFTPTDKMLAGIRFEREVLSYANGELKECEMDHFLLIKKACKQLPSIFLTQFYVSCEILPGVEFYGMCDVVGAGKVQDIKTTGYYDGNKFSLNHQNLYMLCLRRKGIKVSKIDYIVTDFQDVYLESYHWRNYIFDDLLEEVKLFIMFLEDNRHLITDKKIFGL